MKSESAIVKFDFQGHQVRFVGTSENPEWVATDVCKVLGIRNISDAIHALDDDEKGTIALTYSASKTRALTVNESGLYHLIFKSRKPVAKEFRRWVTREVLPSIRKQGFYQATQAVGLEEQPQQKELTVSELISSLNVSDDSILAWAMKYLASGIKTQKRGHLIVTQALLNIYLDKEV